MNFLEILQKINTGKIVPGAVLTSEEGATFYVLSAHVFCVKLPNRQVYFCQRITLSLAARNPSR